MPAREEISAPRQSGWIVGFHLHPLLSDRGQLQAEGELAEFEKTHVCYESSFFADREYIYLDQKAS